MISGAYTEYYFDVEETSSAIHFMFKNNFKNEIEKRRCGLGFELIKSWLIENVGEGVDESYFGGRHKGKRGRGSENKIPVFGILKRNGKVYTQIIPNSKSKTLLKIIRDKVNVRFS